MFKIQKFKVVVFEKQKSGLTSAFEVLRITYDTNQ